MSEPTKTPKGGDSGTSKSRKGRRPQASDLRAAKDELYRRHILAVAESVFAEQGFASTKMQDIARSAELFHRINEQDFAACERTQPAMSSRAYRQGGVLVPAEHHIAQFHEWVVSRLC